jgi:hypothetical protein
MQRVRRGIIEVGLILAILGGWFAGPMGVGKEWAMTNSITAKAWAGKNLPPIDTLASARTETATFALG